MRYLSQQTNRQSFHLPDETTNLDIGEEKLMLTQWNFDQ